MLLTPRCTPERASQIRRVIRRPASESISPLTAATRGRILLQIPVFRRGAELIALLFLGGEVFVQHRLTAGQLSMAVRSPQSLSIRVTRILSTFHPTGASAASAQYLGALPHLPPASPRAVCG